jgi:hypothetical protein
LRLRGNSWRLSGWKRRQAQVRAKWQAVQRLERPFPAWAKRALARPNRKQLEQSQPKRATKALGWERVLM